MRGRDGAISLSVGEVCLADADSLTTGAFDIRSTASRRKAARAKMEAIRSRRWSGVSSSAQGLRNSVGMGRLRREWAEEKQVTFWRYLLHMPSRAGWSATSGKNTSVNPVCLYSATLSARARAIDQLFASG